MTRPQQFVGVQRKVDIRSRRGIDTKKFGRCDSRDRERQIVNENRLADCSVGSTETPLTEPITETATGGAPGRSSSGMMSRPAPQEHPVHGSSRPETRSSRWPIRLVPSPMTFNPAPENIGSGRTRLKRRSRRFEQLKGRKGKDAGAWFPSWDRTKCCRSCPSSRNHVPLSSRASSVGPATQDRTPAVIAAEANP